MTYVAPGGSIEQYDIVSVCTSLISCVHCTVGWVDFKCSAFASCLKFPRYKMWKMGFKNILGQKRRYTHLKVLFQNNFNYESWAKHANT